MCNTCTSKLSTEHILSDLTKTLENPNFGMWNTSSLGHVLEVASGKHGEEAQKIAIQLVEDFYTWYRGPSNGLWEMFGPYTPPSGLVPFPPIRDVRRMIDMVTHK